MDYEWDERKAKRNLRLHCVAFEVALKVFSDRERMDFLDEREDYGEERWITIGYVGDRLLHVTHTTREAGDVIRLISARIATRREANEYHQNLGG